MTVTADDRTNLPLRAEPERLFAPRPCLFGAAQLRLGARAGRALPAAHRGHRRDALPARIRGGDLRGPRLARPRLGAAGASAVRAFRRLSGGARAPRCPGPRLRELREPRPDRAARPRPRGARAVAA